MGYTFEMQAAAAIADPVRREILQLLHAQPSAAGEIAARFTISRPAVSRHLRVLRESGLVRDTMLGRQRIYTLDPQPLHEISSWIAHVTGPTVWGQRFDALETEVARTRRDNRLATPDGQEQSSTTEEIA